jgi:micrococcal nuclease
LLKGKEVKIHRISIDRFGRTIALLYIKQGKEWQALQLLQIKAGTVWANEKYKSDCPIWPAIDREFQKAQRTRTGLFKKSNSIPPWQWRRQNR